MESCKVKYKQHIASAFTLAEVLITLGIIGVVAALTIPTLVGNSEKQTIVSKVKEAYSILSQATQQVNSDCGGDISGCITSSTANNDNDDNARFQVADNYKKKLSLSQDCTNATTGCFANVMYKWLDNSTPFANIYNANFLTNGKFILSNGMSIAFDWNGLASDYFDIYVDINGTQGPNMLGKDTFLFLYDLNLKTLKPHATNDCNTSNSGGGCAWTVIHENAINYY